MTFPPFYQLMTYQNFDKLVAMMNDMIDKHNSICHENQIDKYTIDDVRSAYDQSRPKDLSKESVCEFDKLLNEFLEKE